MEPYLSSEETSVLRQRRRELAEKIVELHYERQPAPWTNLGQSGREKSVRDADYHLAYLEEAINADDPALFSEYLAWVKVLFAGLHFPESVLRVTMDATRRILEEQLPPAERTAALRILNIAVEAMERAPTTLPSFVQGNSSLDTLARRYLDALLRSDRRSASKLILEAVEKGANIRDIYRAVFERTQREVGRLWQMNEISVAQEHFCTAATQMIMSQLYPYIFSGTRKDRSLIVACVGGELHEIGARMVADMFELDGWDSTFLGANTPPESIVAMVKERRSDVVAISATMTFNIPHVVDIVRALRERVTHPLRLLVGGYAFNLSPELWKKIGADGYASDTDTAILTAERLVAV